eukprot:2803491-Lingulodinium_polyedra.AAC.1
MRRIASCPGGGLPTPALRAWLQGYNWQGQRLSADEAADWLVVLDAEKAPGRCARVPRKLRGPRVERDPRGRVLT